MPTPAQIASEITSDPKSIGYAAIIASAAEKAHEGDGWLKGRPVPGFYISAPVLEKNGLQAMQEDLLLFLRNGCRPDEALAMALDGHNEEHGRVVLTMDDLTRGEDQFVPTAPEIIAERIRLVTAQLLAIALNSTYPGVSPVLRATISARELPSIYDLGELAAGAITLDLLPAVTTLDGEIAIYRPEVQAILKQVVFGKAPLSYANLLRVATNPTPSRAQEAWGPETHVTLEMVASALAVAA